MDRFYSQLLKISNFIASLFLFLVGTLIVLFGIYKCVDIAASFDTMEGLIADILKGLDVVFLGIVFQIIGIGFYELFVRPIDALPKWLVITDFDQLKVILVKTSITVMTISFVGKAVYWDGKETIVYYGVAIAAVIAALSYFIKVKSK